MHSELLDSTAPTSAPKRANPSFAVTGGLTGPIAAAATAAAAAAAVVVVVVVLQAAGV